jgi:hypothetical protein
MFSSNPIVNGPWQLTTFNTWLSYSTRALRIFVPALVLIYLNTVLFEASLLIKICSKIISIDINLWLFQTVAYIIHRYGAMYVQLYRTSRLTLSLIADGVFEIIFLTVKLSFVGKYKLYKTPKEKRSSYLSICAWYNRFFSITTYKLPISFNY